MEALAAEIARKRKAKAEEFAGKKYARLADVEAQREAAQRPPPEEAAGADASARVESARRISPPLATLVSHAPSSSLLRR